MASHVAAPSITRQVLFGMPFDPFTLDQAVSQCADALAERRRMLVGVINAAKAVNLRRDSVLRESLLECDMVLADGQSVVWAGRMLRRPLPERVAGIDLFEALLALADRERRSVYLLGAKPEVLETLRSVIGARWPGVVIAGARDGYFCEAEAGQVAVDILNTAPDMLFLGMTSPKKEIFLGQYGELIQVPILHGVGGSFDVMAGLVKRAPSRWQRSGMEWAYRLVQEPGRLWQRYLRTNTAFMALVMRDLVNPTPPYHRSGANRV